MRYLAKITSLPKADTGEIAMIVPTLSGDETRKAYPLKPFLGLYEPYKLGDIVIVENIEGRLYYGDKPYANGEYQMGIPKDSYSFVTPYGYISFTPTNVTIKHINGGQLVVGSDVISASKVSISTKDGVVTSDLKYLQTEVGSRINPPTKWR